MKVKIKFPLSVFKWFSLLSVIVEGGLFLATISLVLQLLGVITLQSWATGLMVIIAILYAYRRIEDVIDALIVYHAIQKEFDNEELPDSDDDDKDNK